MEKGKCRIKNVDSQLRYCPRPLEGRGHATLAAPCINLSIDARKLLVYNESGTAADSSGKRSSLPVSFLLNRKIKKRSIYV